MYGVTYCAKAGYYLSNNYIHAMSMCSLSAPDVPSKCCVACAAGCGILNYNNMIMINDNLGLLVERMICHESKKYEWWNWPVAHFFMWVQALSWKFLWWSGFHLGKCFGISAVTGRIVFMHLPLLLIYS